MGFFEDVDMSELQNDVINTENASDEEIVFSDADFGYNEFVEEEYEDDVMEIVDEEEITNEIVVVEEPESVQTLEEIQIKKQSNIPMKKENIGSSAVSIGTVVNGDVSAEGGLSVDGIINGNVSVGAGLTVFRHGVINGSADVVGKVMISGNVVGNISGDDISFEKAKVTGNIKSSGSINVGQKTVIIGDVYGTNIVIAGAINGDIDVNGHVHLMSTAIVKGNISSRSVQIDNGASIDGTCSQCYADTNPAAFFEKIK